jgi:hypothetical protein
LNFSSDVLLGKKPQGRSVKNRKRLSKAGMQPIVHAEMVAIHEIGRFNVKVEWVKARAGLLLVRVGLLFSNIKENFY